MRWGRRCKAVKYKLKDRNSSVWNGTIATISRICSISAQMSNDPGETNDNERQDQAACGRKLENEWA